MSAAGEEISYTINVQNTGNVDLGNTLVSDSRLTSGLTCQGFTNGGVLRVGTAGSCTGRYRVTDADIAAGVPIVNVASVRSDRTAQLNATASTNVRQIAMFRITKSTTATSVDAAGQLVPYVIVVENTGTQRLTNFQLDDSLPLTSLVCVPPVGSALAVRTSARCDATYTVRQSDINAGVPIVNVATASFAEIGRQSAQVSVGVQRVYGLEITKTGSPTTVDVAGTVVRYTIDILSTGNADQTGLQFSDPLITVQGDRNLQCSPALGSTLAARARITCTGSYTATQNDLDTRTQIDNVATVSTTELPTPRSATATTELRAAPAMTVRKLASTLSVDRADTPIFYRVEVTNTGNQLLRDMTWVDELVPTLVCDRTSLAPTQQAVCSGSYTVSAADMSRGSPISNVVRVRFANLAEQQAQVTTELVQRPSFTMDKIANVASVDAANTDITYTISVVNTGNVALQALRVSDPRLPALSCAPFRGDGTAALPTGQSTNCTGVYRVSQNDINVGAPIVNVATVRVSNPGVQEQTDSVSVPIVQRTAFSLTKQVSVVVEFFSLFSLIALVARSIVPPRARSVIASGTWSLFATTGTHSSSRCKWWTLCWPPTRCSARPSGPMARWTCR